MTNLTNNNTINRTDLLVSKEYWMARIQNLLFERVEHYIETKGINKTEFAKELGYTKSYVTQLLNGDFDNRLSKLVEILLAIGITPEIPMERSLVEFLNDDKLGLNYHRSDIRAINKLRIEDSLLRFTVQSSIGPSKIKKESLHLSQINN